MKEPSKTTQTKIDQAVKGYERIFAAEYQTWLKMRSQKVEKLRDKFATVSEAVRLTHEVPETLDNVLRAVLSEDEHKEFFDCALWFAKTYPEFRVAEKL